VPGAWFPGVAPISWSARDLRIVDGSAALANGELVVTAQHPVTGIALVTLATNFRAREYPAITWSIADLDDNAQVQMLFRTDYAPTKLNVIKVPVNSGRALSVITASDPNWVGRITGIALSIRGPLSQPVRIASVTAKPMGVAGTVAEIWTEWIGFERFSGVSINTVTGGAEVQQLPLPVLLAVVVVLATAIWFVWFVRRRATAQLPVVIVALFVAAWTLLDARWMWNLARQVRETATLYAGKDWRERRLAAEDGPLFAFIEKARALMPSKPVRVFMFADANYFRGRGAYHLYPHNVYFDPWQNNLPQEEALHTGDYVIVYQRRGIQYNAAEKRLRWQDGTPLNAELLLAEHGGAVFRIL